jgi:predicted nucleotidyltransferase
VTIKDLHEKGLVLFDAISGSRAYGLATDTSDTDKKGVFYLPRDHFFGMEYIPQVGSDRNDIVYYEVGRFAELLSKSNPGALELLATPESCVLYRHPLMDLFLPEFVLSKQAQTTFSGYAMTQIKKANGLNRKMRTPEPEERKSLLDFCFVPDKARTIPVRNWLAASELREEHCRLTRLDHTRGLYAIHYDPADTYGGLTAGDQIRCSSVPKDSPVVAYLFCHQDGYEMHCRRHREYRDWLANRNEERYRVNEQHANGYDAKNMMHTIRLLEVALRLFQTGRLEIVSDNRGELLSIKRGEWSYDDLLARAEQLIGETDAAAAVSDLPAEPDRPRIEKALVGIRDVLYSGT